MSHQPSTDGEKILYRVLKKANLLAYYTAFVSQGGDDIQQLCEAGEEEFLEIMALVGMATKPLQVRRLQKALQDWVTSPQMFLEEEVEKEADDNPAKGSILDAVRKMGFSTDGFDAVPLQKLQHVQLNRTGIPPGATTFAIDPASLTLIATSAPPTASNPVNITPKKEIDSDEQPPSLEPIWKSPDLSNISNGGSEPRSLSVTPPSLGSLEQVSLSPYSPGNQSQYSNNNNSSTTVSNQPICTGLSEEQVAAITKAVDEIMPQLPEFTIKRGRMKKIGNKEALKLLDMDPNDAMYLPLLQKYSAIYGRFDCKRKIDKPMCLHEYYVNEASYQLCQRIPELISRRNELFPIARAVVRKSGYKFTKGRSRAQIELLGSSHRPGLPKTTTSTPVKRKPDTTQKGVPNDNDVTSSNNSIKEESDDTSLIASEVDEDSLDHNLRLLQAYGMCELAEELKKNHAKKHHHPEDGSTGTADDGNAAAAVVVEEGVEVTDSGSVVDEQEEWNKQIEEDSKALSESSSPEKKMKLD